MCSLSGTLNTMLRLLPSRPVSFLGVIMRHSPSPLVSLQRDREVMDELASDLAAERTLPLEKHIGGGRTALIETFKKLPTGLESLVGRSPMVTEAIILATGRPTLLIRDGTFEEPHLSVWKKRLSPVRDVLNIAIPSVGRIELLNHPDYEWLGTAWLIQDGVLVTNRHVAVEFSRRNPNGYVFAVNPFGLTIEPRIDFKEEYRVDAVAEVKVEKVLYIANDAVRSPDIAFLLLSQTRGVTLPPPITLASKDPANGAMVAVIGYPAQDSRNSGPLMSDIFRDIYDVKRLAPGYVTDSSGDGIFEHDCTTLGGNSGSPIFDPQSGEAVGLHFSGKFGVSNFAVKATVIQSVLKGLRGGRLVTAGWRPSVDEARSKPEHFIGRDGYNEKFLGSGPKYHVALPQLSPEQMNDAVAIGDGRGLEAFILNYRHFSIVMKTSRRLAYYTAVNIDGTQEVKVGSRRPSWVFDSRISVEYQIGDDVYGGPNKVDRGHLVRRLDPVWGTAAEAKEAHDDTHIFTNAAPQQHTYNDSDWGDLEDYLLYGVNNDDQKLTIFTGPVFRDEDVTWRGVQIPAEFWKVAVLVGSSKSLVASGYLVSHRPYLDDLEFVPGKFRNYQVPIAKLEQLTGLDFGRLKQFDPLAGIESLLGSSLRPLQSLSDIVF